MSFAKIHSAQVSLLKAKQVDIEVDISRGLYSFSIVGLGDKAIEESKDRVCSAIKNSGLIPPKQKNEKIIVSLAPAHTKKHGPLFDVAIALGYLNASGELDIDQKDEKLFLGELALDGNLRPIFGVLPLATFAKKKGFKEMFVPKQNASEAALVSGMTVYGANSLEEIINHINGKEKIEKQPTTKVSSRNRNLGLQKITDFSDVKGQLPAKRGLEIAAAGNHNIALFGPPGTGKTLLAKAFRGILPDMNFEEVLEVTSIHSASGVLQGNLITNRPFRHPHHSASYVAICGGGSKIKPGEVTLAHRGILFLDEFPEFDRRVIDSLRQPLEDGVVCVSRASGSVCYPSDFILVATMNPCPCGYFETGVKACTCTRNQVAKYQQKISGPIVDRIDMWIEVGQIPQDDLFSVTKENKKVSEEIKEKVSKTQYIQKERQKLLNAQLDPKKIELFCPLSDEIREIIKQATKTLHLSARSVHKVIKLARTIADLDGSKNIEQQHVLEALQYRRKS